MPKGIFVRSEEHRKNIALALAGKKKSAEHCASLSKAKAGCVQSLTEEQRQERSERARRIHTGKVTSDGTKQKLSERRKGRTRLLKKYGIDEDLYASQIQAGNKWCSQGKHFSPVSRFHKGRRTFCEDCKSEAHRAQLLRGTYGVTSEWYENTLDDQGGGCAICGTSTPAKGKQFLSIDHNHETGANRGILCHHCNVVVGVIESSKYFKALDYLAKYAPKHPVSFPLTAEQIDTADLSAWFRK